MNKEVEVRFLEIDKTPLVRRLTELGAKDMGEVLLKEVICYDSAGVWLKKGNEIVKLRKKGATIYLTYKLQSNTVDGSEEVELTVSDMQQALHFLERLGYPAYRQQEKWRHTFTLDWVTVDIDTWPRIPTYVELEGESEQALRDVAVKLGLDWNDVVTDNPRKLMEERYNLPIGTMHWFTFDRCE